MKEIEGELLQWPDLKTVWVGDLLEYEGPILALLADAEQNGKYYLSKWVDIVDGLNRWIVLPFEESAMEDFFCGRSSLKDIIHAQPQVYLYDYHLELTPERVYRIKQEQVPADYLPEFESYYSQSAYSQFAADFWLGRQRAGPDLNAGPG
jgi:hypothetical protein